MLATKQKTKEARQETSKYTTKSMQAFHEELQELKDKKLIKSFWLPGLINEKSKPEKNKFKAKKCIIDGNTVASIMEARFYAFLIRQKHEGNIKDFEFQPRFVLLESFEKLNKKIKPITYIADFLVTCLDNTQIVYDVKGRKTDVFSLKRKLFDNRYKNLPLRCVKFTIKKGWFDQDTNEEICFSTLRG